LQASRQSPVPAASLVVGQEWSNEDESILTDSRVLWPVPVPATEPPPLRRHGWTLHAFDQTSAPPRYSHSPRLPLFLRPRCSHRPSRGRDHDLEPGDGHEEVIRTGRRGSSRAAGPWPVEAAGRILESARAPSVAPPRRDLVPAVGRACRSPDGPCGVCARHGGNAPTGTQGGRRSTDMFHALRGPDFSLLWTFTGISMTTLKVSTRFMTVRAPYRAEQS
jgi:hypothetical protein